MLRCEVCTKPAPGNVEVMGLAEEVHQIRKTQVSWAQGVSGSA